VDDSPPGPPRAGARGRPRHRAIVALAALVAVLCSWLITGCSASAAGTGTGAPVSTGTADPAGPAGGAALDPNADLRSKARAVLSVIDSTGAAPAGYVGGRPFLNDGRGGTAPLPRRDSAGRAITYHEYDVNPYRPGVNRGPQRLVVGSDGSAWYTGDHYVTWVRLR
jgi:guanyl-specific ribonuclease Sa